jgi:hypothetical protein
MFDRGNPKWDFVPAARIATGLMSPDRGEFEEDDGSIISMNNTDEAPPSPS